MLFYYKTPVHRRMRERIPYLRNCTFKLRLTLISLSRPSVALFIIVPLRAPSPKSAPLRACSPKLCPTSLRFALRRCVSPSITPRCIKSDSFRNPLYSYYLLYFTIPHRLLKRGSTSPRSIILIAGSSHCKHINGCLVPKKYPSLPVTPWHGYAVWPR